MASLGTPFLKMYPAQRLAITYQPVTLRFTYSSHCCNVLRLTCIYCHQSCGLDIILKLPSSMMRFVYMTTSKT